MNEKNAVRFKLGELLTVEELAAKLKVSVKTIRSWVFLRKITFTKIQRRVYFSVGVLEQMLQRAQVPALQSSPEPMLLEQGGANDKETEK